MRLTLILVLAALSASCTPQPTPMTSVTPLTARLNPAPNTAPRGSEEFCRTYGRQTAASRILASPKSNGGGANGYSVLLAQREGDRAYERCRTGRLN